MTLPKNTRKDAYSAADPVDHNSMLAARGTGSLKHGTRNLETRLEELFG